MCAPSGYNTTGTMGVHNVAVLLFSLLVRWSSAASLDSVSEDEVQRLLSEWRLETAFGKQVRQDRLFAFNLKYIYFSCFST